MAVNIQLNDWLSLVSSSSSIRVDLDLRTVYNDMAQGDIRKLFWQFIQKFNTTELLKLKLDCSMDRVAFIDKDSQDELLWSLFFYGNF